MYLHKNRSWITLKARPDDVDDDDSVIYEYDYG